MRSDVLIDWRGSQKISLKKMPIMFGDNSKPKTTFKFKDMRHKIVIDGRFVSFESVHEAIKDQIDRRDDYGIIPKTPKGLLPTPKQTKRRSYIHYISNSNK